MLPNIILIIIDAMRMKNVSFYGYNKSTTPNIDKFASENIVFKNAFSTINTTDPSLISLLTGQYPSSHGLTSHGNKVDDTEIEVLNRLRSDFLQEILARKGYNSICIDFIKRMYHEGFDDFLSRYQDPSFKGNIKKKLKLFSPKILEFIKKVAVKSRIKSGYSSRNYKPLKYTRDIHYTKIAQDKIIEFSKKKSPFFIFLHYWGVHMPYEPPIDDLKELEDWTYESDCTIDWILESINGLWKSRLKKFTTGIKSCKEMLLRYDACIKFVDKEIGKILKILKQQNIYDNTIILITSDHGESLLEHEIYFDHHGLYDVSIRVPLIIRLPNYNHKIIDNFVQHIDITPTLLDYLGILHTQDLDGKSLLDVIENVDDLRELIFIEEYHTQQKKAIRTKKYKYIYSDSEKNALCEYCGKIHGGIEELYDLEKDPNEIQNLVSEKPEIVKLFKDLLRIKFSQITERTKISNIIKDLKKTKKIQ